MARSAHEVDLRQGLPTSDSRKAERHTEATSWEGVTAREWGKELDVSQVIVFHQVTSTMDVAHDLAAADATAPLLVLSDRQTSGRGRGGRTWVSQSGDGIWMTLLERPTDAATVEVWALRMGICVARVLDAYADSQVSLKWPNDLYVRAQKVAGILVEARWQDQRLQWAAVGLGVNVRAPEGVAGSGALRAGTSRGDVLRAVVPALRAATQMEGVLTAAELRDFAARDLARGHRCRQPAIGRVEGIGRRGELLIATPEGTHPYRTGSLVLDDEMEQP